ncbi:ABC transporter ATP-binding protein [Actinospica sp. MGRD01-02]|uniref:ABC transporter ATP-binding protein n=1 Tax=Actinospica acidithermotolerans TaxID=2828514 RepID=A0A941E9Q8_9ACTN|nr:ABC transporter ATP-binding protein [Actinospica acidithermotolerans]MBR7826598.1 ABC transporter ATP-binding protein [Actinospica acidithermotolerans]
MTEAQTPAADLASLEREAETEARTRAGYGADALILCDRLVRVYAADGVEVQALQGLDLVIRPGELTAIVGASGSGKSTLLNILSGLDRPTAGRARVADHDLLTMKGRERLRYRRETVGFIWQQTGRNLLPYLDARENVETPLRLAGVSRSQRRKRAAELLDLLDIGYCADRKPNSLSGGEQQRVAIGVALANRPKVVLADEPTGELDTASADTVFQALRTANDELGVAVLVVTHDENVSGQVPRTVQIRDGRTSSEVLRTAFGDRAKAEEFALLDRAGRIQLPAEYIDALELRDRVRLGLEPEQITVRDGRADGAHPDHRDDREEPTI